MNEENQNVEGFDFLEEENEPKETSTIFAPPFGSKFGASSVDLDIKKNHDAMRQEYKTWWDAPKGEEKDKLYEEFNQKYYGMPTEEVRKQSRGSLYGSANPLKVLDNTLQGLSAPGAGLVDFVMDAAGTLIPGFDKIDEKYDQLTMLDNPGHQGIRRISSIVLPSILGGNMVQGQLNAKMAGGALFSKPWFNKLTASLTAHGITDSAILGLSDIGEEATMTDDLSQMFPKTFGPQGNLPLPSFFRTNKSTSPKTRKLLNMLESAPFTVLGTTIGAFMDTKQGTKTLDWFEPLDEASSNYKQSMIEIGSDNEKLIRMQEIDELLSLGDDNLSKEVQDMLINEKLAIEDSLGGVTGVDDAIRRKEAFDEIETEAAIDNKLNNMEQLELDLNTNNLDPDLNSDLLDDAAKAKQSVPPGNVAQNMVDTTAIKSGTSTGDPAPIITDSMRRKGLMVGPTSRGAVMGVAEEARDIGRFNAVVDGIRFGTKEMNAAAWGIYNDIIAAPSVDDLREIFFSTKDVKNLLGGLYKVEYAPEDTIRGTAFAIKYLFDRFLGRPVAESSARVMDTLGREVDTIANALDDMAPSIDRNRAMDLIIGKLEFLLDEYALNKYISGWQLRNKNWFDQTPPGNIQDAIETLTTEFTGAENAIHAKNRKFTKELKRLQKENPTALKPLIDAFSHTSGDVDSLAKLMKWAAEQITPLGLLKSPDPKNMNLFAKGAWGVRYNNMLSGISAFRAGLGNGVQLLLRPLTAFLGHGITGNIDGLRRTLYYNSAIYETNRRALHDAFTMMKKTHKDPTAMLNAFRKDFVFKTDKAWDIMEDVAKIYETQGNWGRAYQYKIASTLKQMAGMKWLRYGMTGMVFPDVFTNTHLATYLSRVNAYADVMDDAGFPRLPDLRAAEAENYAKYFDKEGLVKDNVLRSLSGEIQLNIDDGLSGYLTDATTAYPILKEVMAFPRTASNYMKAGASYTPVSLIPGISKYSKTIYARTSDDIAEALMEHGIDMTKTPNAQVIFENLRAEYIGRMAFSGLLVGTLYQYAMGGNIRGNGHYNASRRNKERTEMGYEPKTIKVGNNFYSYKGIIGIEHMLAIIGDLAYYAGDMDEHMMENWQSKLTWTVGATFLNESPIFGLEKIFDMLNGNERAASQFLAGAGASMVPNSGGLGVVANAIDSAQKDIEGDIGSFFKNRFPGLKGTLPNQIDIWTGTPVNDIDNPVLRALNALSPVQVSGTDEPWRVWLRSIGYNGLSMLKKDSSGSYEWAPEDREIINKYIGEQQMFKEVERLMRSKRYQGEIKSLQLLRKTNLPDSDAIRLKTTLLPVHQELNQIIRNAQKIAEMKYLKDKPLIEQAILNAQMANQLMKEGDVEGASQAQQKDVQLQNLIQMRK